MIVPDVIADLDRQHADPGSSPLHRQIYERIAAAVLDGRLTPGARLPSSRSLAAQLSVARGTVDAAYQQLAGEGYVVTRGAAGTRIDPALDARTPRPAPAAEPAGAAGLPTASPPPGLFQGGLPALDAFPRKTWARLAAREARALGRADLAYQPPRGDERLRIQTARHLAIARGIHCRPGEVMITGGFQGALGLAVRTLLKPSAAVWVEDPGYRPGRNAIRLAGARPVGVPVDGEGFDVTRAGSDRAPASMALVTPTHQFPLGMSMSLQRRMALLQWAASAGGWIVEDDYDSEFRYEGRPIPALKSLDRCERVLYAGTFSKVLAPGLRVGYLVLPPGLVERFAEVARLLQPPPSALVQATIAAFMERGDLARHIRRMRALYARRRAAVAEALMDQGAAGLRIELQPGGMHLVARLPSGTDDVGLAARLADDGIAVHPLSACHVESAGEPGLLIGFTNVETERAPNAARRLRAAIERAQAGGA